MPKIEGLTRAEYRALERLWVQEVGMGSVNMTPKMRDRLMEKGMIEVNEITLAGRFPVTLQIPRFTLRGHYLYAKSIPNDPDPTRATDKGA